MRMISCMRLSIQVWIERMNKLLEKSDSTRHWLNFGSSKATVQVTCGERLGSGCDARKVNPFCRSKHVMNDDLVMDINASIKFWKQRILLLVVKLDNGQDNSRLSSLCVHMQVHHFQKKTRGFYSLPMRCIIRSATMTSRIDATTAKVLFTLGTNLCCESCCITAR